MSALKRLQDFFAWLGEVADGFAADAPPRRALGVEDGAVALLRREAGGYVAERPARPGDAAPLRLGDDDALVTRFFAPGEAAIHGRSAARIEAARRCPFPLDAAFWSLTPAPEAWTEGAPWRLAAAPRAKLDALRQTVAATGARPGPAFALIDGAPVTLTPNGRARRAPLVAVAAFICVIAAAGAAALVETGAARIEAEAQARLDEARGALNEAEESAARAAVIREETAAPIRAALAGDALFRSAPQAGAALVALTAAAPDDAHARRLTIRPGEASGEFIAPDAAALARALTASAAFDAVTVDGAARTDADSGLQRAVLNLRLAGADE